MSCTKAFSIEVTEAVLCADPIIGELSAASDRFTALEITAAASPFYVIKADYTVTAGKSIQANYTAGGFSPAFYYIIEGTATGGGGPFVDQLEDSSQSWDNNIFVGLTLAVTAGTNAGFFSTIYANDADTIFTNDAFPSPPDATTEYTIFLASGTTAARFIPTFSGAIKLAATSSSASDVGTVDVQFECCNSDTSAFPIIALPNKSIAYDPISDQIFGNNTQGFSLEVMDATTRAPVTSLPYVAWDSVLTAGQNAAIRSPGDGMIYAGMEISGGAATLQERVHVIDPATNVEIADYALSRQGASASNLASFAYDPVRAKMYAICRNANRVDSSGVIDQIDTPTSRKWYSGLYMPQSDVMWFGADNGANGTANIDPIDPTTNPPTVLPTGGGAGFGYNFSAAPWLTGSRITKMINPGFDNWFALATAGYLAVMKVLSSYEFVGSIPTSDFTLYIFTSIVDIHYRASDGWLYISSGDVVRRLDILTGSFETVDCRFPGGYFVEDGSGNLLLSGPCIQYIA